MSNVTDAASPHPLDELLAHRAWVRALARRLVHDDASADDLAQQTWLAALRHPPEHSGSLRGWLAQVLRNTAHDGRRSDKRRSAREDRVRREDVSPAAVDVVARAEIQRLVIEAVFALDEPCRRTVLMRYFDGLAVGDVANREGVSPEAIRKRLSRAHAQLRTALDHDHGGERRAWCTLLTPLVGDTAPDVVPLRPTTVAAARVAVPAMLIAGAAALVVVIGATAVWTLGGGDSPGFGDVADVSKVPRKARDRVRRDGGAATAAVVNGTPTTARDGAIPPRWDGVDDAVIFHGRCETLDGESPVVGAVVRIGDRTSITDSDGRYLVDALRPGRRYWLTVAADGLATASMTVEAAPPGARVELLDVRLAPSVGASVQVLSPDGQTVAGSTVRLFGVAWSVGPISRMNVMPGADAPPRASAESLADSDGRATFADLAPGGYVIVANRDGFAASAPRQVWLPLPSSSAGTEVVRLRRPAVLTGTVVDRVTGDGVPGIQVAASSQESQIGTHLSLDTRWTWTADDGSFRIAELAAGPIVAAARRADGALHGTVTADLRAVSDLTIFVAASASVSGVAVDEKSGERVPLAWLQLTVQSGHVSAFSERRFARADSDGRFVFDDLQVGALVHVGALDGGPWCAAWSDDTAQLARRVVAADGGAELVVPLRHRGGIAGVVSLPSGEPVLHAEILVVGEQRDVGTTWLDAIVARTRTDAAGRYRVDGLEPGDVQIVARTATLVAHGYRRTGPPFAGAPDGPWPLRVRIVASETVQWDVALDRGIEVSGVVLAADGTPAAGVQVVTSNRHTSSDYDRSTRSDADGNFTLTGIRFESAPLELLAFTRTAIARVSVAAPVSDHRESGVELRLAPREANAVRLRGRIVDAFGGLVSGVRLHVDRNAANVPLEGLRLRHRAAYPRGLLVAVELDGTFCTDPFDLVGVTHVAILASAPGRVPRQVVIAASDIAGAGEIRIELKRGGTIRGRLFRHDGAAAAGVPVQAASCAPGAFRSTGVPPQTVTGDDGSFTISGLDDLHHCLNFGQPGALVHRVNGAFPGRELIEIRLPASVDLERTAVPDPPPPAIEGLERTLPNTAAAMAEGRDVKGRVLDPQGRTVGHARLRFESLTATSRLGASTITHRDGTFSCRLQSGRSYRLDVDAGERGWVTLTGIRARSDELVVRLRPRSDVPCRGSVANADGRVASGAWITAMRVRDGEPPLRLRLSDRGSGRDRERVSGWDRREMGIRTDGTFDFGYLPRGKWVLFAGRPGRSHVPANLLVHDSAAPAVVAEAPLRLTTTIGWTLRARLLEEDGTPAVGVRVRIKPSRALPAPFPEVEITRHTGRYGAVEITGLPAGAVTIIALSDSGSGPQREWRVAEQSPTAEPVLLD